MQQPVVGNLVIALKYYYQMPDKMPKYPNYQLEHCPPSWISHLVISTIPQPPWTNYQISTKSGNAKLSY